MSAAKQAKNTLTQPEAQDEFTSLKGNNQQGELVIRRASKFAEQGIVDGTVVALGLYETRKANKFAPEKYDYFVRGADNTLYIVGETSVLRNQMDEIADCEGAKIRITYLGMGTNKKGKEFHNWDVSIAK